MSSPITNQKIVPSHETKQMTSSTPSVSTAPPQDPVSHAGPACDVVFVQDSQGRPLMPTTPRRARLLRKAGRVDLVRCNPATIRLRDRDKGDVQPMELKIDPGSKTTGLSLVVQCAQRGWVVLAAWELTHRGQQIVQALLSRAANRRGRRTRHTRYRPARFLNRTQLSGWLPPSLRSRIANVVALVRKTMTQAPVSVLVVEDVRFDMQQLENPEISGVEYQQGTLAGYEVREYLLLKWQHRCTYCTVNDVPLQVEHIVPISRGGPHRISNLCLACGPCNQKKANRPVAEFLKEKPDLLASILAQAKRPLKDAAAVNSTRKSLVVALQGFELPVHTGTGGRTKFNRTQQGYAKSHWLDAACVGDTGAEVDITRIQHITQIKARGRGSRQMCQVDKFGFPRSAPKTVKRIHGFQTGDRVRLIQPHGKYKGVHDGLVAVRASGQFELKTTTTKITAPHTRFTLVDRFNGYATTHRSARRAG